MAYGAAGNNQQDIDPNAEVDDRSLVKLFEANVIEAETSTGSEVSEQRQKNHEYYSGASLGNEKDGRSHHVSFDVLDAVESAKSFYMEAFGTNRRPIRFFPEDGRDMTARLSTEYVTEMFVDDNSGFEFLRDSLHDAFVAKRCVAHVEWCEHYEEGFEDFQGPEQQLDMLLARDERVGVENFQYVDAERGIVSARIVKDVDKSYAKLDLIAPEKFYRDPNVAHVRDSAYAGWHDDYSRGELINKGFQEEEVRELRLDYRFRQEEEDAARKAHDSSWNRKGRMTRDPSMEEVTVYCHYAWVDINAYLHGVDADAPDAPIGDVRLYKFYFSAGKLLTNPETGEKWQEVTDGDMPFEEWTQYKISHAEHGLCDADLAKSLQWDKSNLRRLIIDNQAMANTSRWKARHSFIKNPRELLENKIGSVLWVKDMKALEPLETPLLSPLSFQLEEKLDQEKENRTGMSRLAKGMSGDAVSHQNADSMIQRLTNASNRRVLRGVRDYAETFIKPILIRMHNLGVRHDRQQRIITIAGQHIPITPMQFPVRRKMKVAAALTPDEGREEGMFLLQMHTVMREDEELAALYTADKRYQLMTDVFDCYGHADASHYLKPPNDPQVQQMKQMQTKMMQMQQQMAHMETMLKQSKEQREWTKLQNDIADTASDNLREDDKFRFERRQWEAEFAEERRMNDAEIAIERSQARAASIGK